MAVKKVKGFLGRRVTELEFVLLDGGYQWKAHQISNLLVIKFCEVRIKIPWLLLRLMIS